MTTRWEITPDWAGETVAIFGNGPGMSAELVESARHHKTIAVHRAVQYAPRADMFVALDPVHHIELDFEGMKVCGIECDVDALYAGLFYERVILGPAHIIDIRNNALAAMRIAQKMGAAKIGLYGFDAERYEALHAFRGFVVGLAQLTAELRAKGIEVFEAGGLVAVEDEALPKITRISRSRG